MLYATDVIATGGDLRAIEIPPGADVRAAYVIGVLRDAPRPRPARAWLELTLGPAGQEILAAAGFEPVAPEHGRR